MTYFAGDDNDDGIRPIDIDDLYDEVSWVINTAVDATNDESIDLEINIVSKYEVEFGLTTDRLSKVTWYDDLDQVKSALVKLYPEGDWEDSGWR